MTAPAVVILGNDALLAARPATPVQLAHACLAAGYRAVVPASWGDELVAAATTQILAGRSERPAIHCACPHVARRVLAVGSELAPFLVSIVAPPVAAARYVRRHSAGSIRIAYVGRCPAAADDSIDARLTPEELLAQIADRGIDLLSQPTVFESVIPPDRRRYLSLPGGLPTGAALRARGEIVIESLSSADLATTIAEKVVGGTNSLIDVAPSVGCACSGASAGGTAAEARAAVMELEPPRATASVVDTQGAIALELPVTIGVRSALDVIASPREPAPYHPPAKDAAPPAVTPVEPSPPRRPRITPAGVEQVILPSAMGASSPTPAAPRRRSVGVQRVIPGALPVASDQEGRVLPRMYVARRRSPRAGTPAFVEPPFEPPLEVARPITPAVEPPPPPVSAIPREPSAPRTADESSARETTGEQPQATDPAPVDLETSTTSDTAEPSVAPPTVADMAVEAPREDSSVEAAPEETPLVTTTSAAPLAPDAVGAPPAPEPAQGTRTAGLATSLPIAQVRARLQGSWRAVRANSRLTLAALLGAAGLLLGVAIGWAAARRGGDASGVVAPESVETSGGNVGAESAGRVVAPTPRVVPQRSVQPAPRNTPRRATARPDRARASTDPARSPATVPVAPAPVDSVAAQRPAVDSAAAVRADSIRREIARAEALAAEREAIRRELEARRARIDSLTRRVGELSTPPSRPATPPR